jgi:hypothetical protein
MRLGQRFTFVLLAISALVVLPVVASADTLPTVAEANLLSGAAAISTSTLNSTYVAANVTDGKFSAVPGDDSQYALIFGDPDTMQTVGILNFNATAGINKIRVWSKGDWRTPGYLAVWSSANANAGLTKAGLTFDGGTGVADNFEKVVMPSTVFAGSPVNAIAHVGIDTANPIAGYTDYAVNIAAGTKSLMLAFGGGCYLGTSQADWNGGAQALIGEVQAFAPTPEPGTIVLLATGLIGLLAYAWRKRK